MPPSQFTYIFYFLYTTFSLSMQASQLERGTLRRCLFDESQRKNSADQFGFSNPIVNAQIQESANMSYGKSGNRHMINLSKPAIDASVSPGNYPVVISKSLGIGLHLNSVVYSGSTDSAIGSQQSSMVSVEGNSSPQITNNQSDGKINASNIVGISSASREEIDQHQAHLVPAYDTTIAPDLDEQFNTAIDAKLDPCSTITNDKRKSSPDLDENDSSLGSPKKTRQASNCLTSVVIKSFYLHTYAVLSGKRPQPLLTMTPPSDVIAKRLNV